MFTNIYSNLKKAGIFNEDNCNTVVKNYCNNRLDSLASVLSNLQEATMLTQDNFNLIANHTYPFSFAGALCDLQQFGILTSENRAMIAAHTNPFGFACALRALKRVGFLTPENRAMVAAHANPSDLASALLQLTQYPISFIVKPNAIIIETNEAYLSSKDFVPSSIHHMLIPKEHHIEREKYLNRIIAFFLNKTLKSLPLDVVAYILEFIEEMPLYRSEAIEVIQPVQLPKNLDLNVYKNDLKNKTQEYTQFEAELCHLKICKQNLLLKLDNLSFWDNRHSCPEAQHVFDRQYGLVIGA